MRQPWTKLRPFTGREGLNLHPCCGQAVAFGHAVIVSRLRNYGDAADNGENCNLHEYRDSDLG